MGYQLSLIMPAFNEAEGIETAIREAVGTLNTLTDEHELIIVDDGSRDDTAHRVDALRHTYPTLRLIPHRHNAGYGAALRTGFRAARHELISFTDADAQFDLRDLGRLISLTDQYPLVVGYRIARQDPWKRLFLSWGYNQLVRALLGTRVRDCDCALKVIRRDVLDRLLPTAPNFFVNTEMLARANRLGIPVVEIGVKHRPRRYGSSTVSLWDVPCTLRTLVPFWFRQTFAKSGS